MFSELTEQLKSKKIAVIGAGGLGGIIINLLARMSLGKIIIFDGDVFDNSNLNRQLHCNLTTIGQNKAKVAAEEAMKISLSETVAVAEFFQEKHLPLIKGFDCIIDATDNVSTRLYLEQISIRTGITIIHGAINAFFGQVAVVRPGDKTLSKLYLGRVDRVRETISIVPSLVGTFQACQAAKFLVGSNCLKSGEVLLIDVYSCDIKVINV